MIDSRIDGWMAGMKSSGYAARSSNKDKVEIATQRGEKMIVEGTVTDF